jgi:hypothetical protein
MVFMTRGIKKNLNLKMLLLGVSILLASVIAAPMNTNNTVPDEGANTFRPISNEGVQAWRHNQAPIIDARPGATVINRVASIHEADESDYDSEVEAAFAGIQE